MNSSNSHPQHPPTEVSAKATRRHFTAEYKRKILQEADACTQPGQIGALLRREGLYSSHLVKWREARDHGQLAGLEPLEGKDKIPPGGPTGPRSDAH